MKKFTNEELQTMVQDMNSWNGSFEDIYVWDMSMFDEAMHGFTAVDIANRIHYGEFNPSHEFFRFDGYGNLESLTDYCYGEELQDRHDEIVEAYREMVEDGDIEDWNDMLEEEEAV